MDLSNVNPLPFTIAQPPASLFGRSLPQQLPQVGGYSREDLERMRATLVQSGSDPGMLGRIDEVIAMRSAGTESAAPPLMLRPTPQKQSRVGRAVGNTIQARQQLLDALSQQPQ